MTDEEMAEDYIQNGDLFVNNKVTIESVKQAYLAGLKAGRPQWHYVKDGLPETSGRYYVYTGGEPFILDYDTECSSFGYWTVLFGDNWGVRDEVFETVKDSGEDEVVAWCEIPMFEGQK